MTEKSTTVTVDVTNRIWIRAAACVPEEYEIVVSGTTQPGDRLYDLWGEWHGEPLQSPKDDQLIGIGVATFYAVARRKGQAPC